jgi:hypothetical protein
LKQKLSSLEAKIREHGNGITFKADSKSGLKKAATELELEGSPVAVCFSNKGIFLMKDEEGYFYLEDINALKTFNEVDPEDYEEYLPLYIVGDEGIVKCSDIVGLTIPQDLVDAWEEVVKLQDVPLF